MSRLTSAAMFELIIFDMDGVLVDSEDAMAQMTVRALEEWGIHSSPDDFTRFRGMGDRAYVGGVSEMYGVPYDERMKEEAYRLFCENAGELVHVMPWTVPLLCELERRRFACAVASAADRIKVECNLGCIGKRISDFAAVVTGADVVNLKPAPDIFLKTAADAGVPPEKCAVCEDSLSGIRAAKAAGADTVTDDLCDLLSVLGPGRPIRA